MNTKLATPLRRGLSVASLVLFFFCACTRDSDQIGIPYDPAKPVTINRFLPDSGGVSTQLVIFGSNFGNDTSLVRVTVNDFRAPLIGMNDSAIYVLVPSKAGTGNVKVTVGAGTAAKEGVSPKEFIYIFRPSVSTLSGFTDKDGRTAIVDGSIDKAQYEEPYWLCYDEQKNIYVLEEGRALRMINADKTQVTTKWRTGNGLDRPRTLSFNPTYDTLFITNDQWDWAGLSTAVATKADNFTRWTSLVYSKTTNGGAAQPQTGDYFFNAYETGAIFEWDRQAKVSRELFRIGDVSWEFNIQFAPSGDFAYIVVKNQHYILKSRYNRETRKLETPVHFVGTRRTEGYRDGVGVDALFRQPHQGAFDDEDNFYVCDVFNHCIRKITPEGVVSTFAGRPGTYGYTDGALRDARFDRPMGIVYERETGSFIVADQKNRRIRIISTE
ncbi:MAG: IPT/TIG domain-containing protein [Candidatus Pseudobacter hemicellulosilyticus]|uniref:IPT/TIG domain-containing protein n=1 Tax=Candidatus Pseudobacter hemicellulosilyticus TaxID=3121375 RepID=A0AAJ6BFY6_9BACT|nr:MAG: IPT/TIG domain-containing protein [Pseudobacter sp.]